MTVLLKEENPTREKASDSANTLYQAGGRGKRQGSDEIFFALYINLVSSPHTTLKSG